MHSDRREENTMMVETIKRLAETAEWASVYTDREDTEHFSCGYSGSDNGGGCAGQRDPVWDV